MALEILKDYLHADIVNYVIADMVCDSKEVWKRRFKGVLKCIEIWGKIKEIPVREDDGCGIAHKSLNLFVAFEPEIIDRNVMMAELKHVVAEGKRKYFKIKRNKRKLPMTHYMMNGKVRFLYWRLIILLFADKFEKGRIYYPYSWIRKISRKRHFMVDGIHVYNYPDEEEDNVFHINPIIHHIN